MLDGAYLDLTYSQARAPESDYPTLLARHLLAEHYRAPGRLLDFGCGRGDALRAFASLGFEAVGADVSERAAEMAPEFEVAVVDPETSRLPFGDDSFDFVFSKSVVEHMRSPIDLGREAARVLRPGGIAIVMTPSWQHQAWGPFYIDHTHVTPFTAPSLKDLMTLAGLEQVRSEHFYQLPFVWRASALQVVPKLVALLPLPYRPYNEGAAWPDAINKLIRFSKEVMLLAAGRKP
jgi:SAM-dependent methyltransferase